MPRQRARSPVSRRSGPSPTMQRPAGRRRQQRERAQQPRKVFLGAQCRHRADHRRPIPPHPSAPRRASAASAGRRQTASDRCRSECSCTRCGRQAPLVRWRCAHRLRDGSTTVLRDEHQTAASAARRRQLRGHAPPGQIRPRYGYDGAMRGRIGHRPFDGTPVHVTSTSGRQGAQRSRRKRTTLPRVRPLAGADTSGEIDRAAWVRAARGAAQVTVQRDHGDGAGRLPPKLICQRGEAHLRAAHRKTREDMHDERCGRLAPDPSIARRGLRFSGLLARTDAG